MRYAWAMVLTCSMWAQIGNPGGSSGGPVAIADGTDNSKKAWVGSTGELKANVLNFPGSFQVSNFPLVQAVSQSGAWTVAVSNATQAVTQSGNWTVGVNNFPATQAVSGTFWQATQPVSGPLTDAQLRASAVPMTWSGVLDPCMSPFAAKTSVVINASTTSAQQVIALSGSTVIYVCHYTIVGGGTTPTWVLEYGTGTNCGTGTTALNTAFAIPTTPFTIGWGGTVHKTAAGNALCTLLTGTSPTAKGYLTYVQQ